MGGETWPSEQGAMIPRISEGQYALDVLTLFALWLFVGLPILYIHQMFTLLNGGWQHSLGGMAAKHPRQM